MKNLLAKFFESLAKDLRSEKKEDVYHVVQPQEETITEILETPTEILLQEAVEISPCKLRKNINNVSNISINKKRPKDVEEVPFVKDTRDIRDIMDLMEVPFVALSKNRRTPIVYESPDGKLKVKISCHPPYYLASIYDWDIIILISSNLQEIINSRSDIPPRTFTIPRHELLKEIHKHSGRTSTKEIESALNRLKSTLIETTIHNEDYRYRGGFGFIDSWGYTERKDIKEFRITLSEWLYEIICQKGSLLKVQPEYFKITSGLKRFLYRTARKHVGIQNESWEFSIETLHKKSGSEQEFKKFKYDLKKAVKGDYIPGYLMQWIEKDSKTYVRFLNRRKELRKMLSEHKAPKFQGR